MAARGVHYLGRARVAHGEAGELPPLPVAVGEPEQVAGFLGYFYCEKPGAEIPGGTAGVLDPIQVSRHMLQRNVSLVPSCLSQRICLLRPQDEPLSKAGSPLLHDSERDVAERSGGAGGLGDAVLCE